MMTQFEYAVWHYIQGHPRCTKADILASFAKAPDNAMLENALDALRFQNLIQELPIQPPSAPEPLITYYPSETSTQSYVGLKA